VKVRVRRARIGERRTQLALSGVEGAAPLFREKKVRARTPWTGASGAPFASDFSFRFAAFRLPVSDFQPRERAR
jgi:hypothetical protein